MSSDSNFVFSKENIDIYLKAVAKEYRRLVGKGTPAELILIGGASVLINYGFRNMTNDIDALICASSAMKDAINNVGNKYNLPVGWLNEDFKKTESYSDKLIQFSQYYRTYSNVLCIRTVSSEYLIAMKLKSGRQYKRDLSDVVGILIEHNVSGNPISMEMISKAVIDLYGCWNELPETSRSFIQNVKQADNLETLYQRVLTAEIETKKMLKCFENNYPDVKLADNVNEITLNLQRKSDSASVLASLLELKRDTKKPSDG